ncbi:YhhA family cyclophane-containing RiPP [Mucilaginibacter kameinonensis]|uniref:YhhA family cyclophane-containing RiPP n=1 Tax=Mucilaginibacter kameinonensis TaxID=452286 RepID=UPI000EF764FF|nr:YhhA family cyclophane-containing RiPP [Mucilaginibacter kameinonensis]
MEQTNEKYLQNEAAEQQAQQIVIDHTKMDNEVLKRLIGEIDFEKENRIHSYNRTHNRHNRGR